MVSKSDVALVVIGGVAVSVVGGVATHWFIRRLDGVLDAFGNVTKGVGQAGEDIYRGVSGDSRQVLTGAPDLGPNPKGQVLVQRFDTPTGTVEYPISIPTPVFPPYKVTPLGPKPQKTFDGNDDAMKNYSYIPNKGLEDTLLGARNAFIGASERVRVGFNKTKPFRPYLVPNAGARLLYRNIKGWF